MATDAEYQEERSAFRGGIGGLYLVEGRQPWDLGMTHKNHFYNIRDAAGIPKIVIADEGFAPTHGIVGSTLVSRSNTEFA